MSQRTYFLHPETLAERSVFISIDSKERARLRRRGWVKITRREAQLALGGPQWLDRALGKCSTGLVEINGVDPRCHGHTASRS